MVSDTTGVSVYFPWRDDDMKLDAFEDDECLHIHKSGVHACFSVGGNDYTSSQQNERTKAVLNALGLKKLITIRVLVEEEDEHDEECPHCGR